jgi:hypothetical protein
VQLGHCRGALVAGLLEQQAGELAVLVRPEIEDERLRRLGEGEETSVIKL